MEGCIVTFEEIAKALGITLGEVRKAYNSAMKKLKQIEPKHLKVYYEDLEVMQR